MDYALPTQAQWEYAVRGGKNQREWPLEYAGSQELAEVACYGYDEMSYLSPLPLGLKAPNGLGLYDMSGKVAEWGADWYGAYPQKQMKDPQGPKRGTRRVIRGDAGIMTRLVVGWLVVTIAIRPGSTPI